MSGSVGIYKETIVRLVAAAAFAVALSAPLIAFAAVGTPADAPTVTVRGDLNPTTPQAAQALMQRLETAAMEVCGASEFSPRDLKLAVRASACWRKALDGAVARIDSPLLTGLRGGAPASEDDRATAGR